MRGLCQSLPEKLHARTSSIVGPAGVAAQLANKTDPTPRQTDAIEGPRHHLRHIEALATVFDTNRQATALAVWSHLQMHPHIAIPQLVQARVTLLIIARKT